MTLIDLENIMSYVFFKENITDMPSKDFYNLNFSKEFIENIKNRLNEYVNKDNIFELLWKMCADAGAAGA